MQRKLFMMLLISFPLFSKAQIQNQDYHLMLDSLYKNTVPLITVDSLKEIKKSVVLLDAREKDEYAVSHLKNALNVGFIWFDMRKIYQIPKEQTIVIYCSVGYRSEKIGEKLIRNGYKHVYNLYGGIFEWENRGFPLYKDNGVQTTEIHTYNKKWAKWVNRGSKVY